MPRRMQTPFRLAIIIGCFLATLGAAAAPPTPVAQGTIQSSVPEFTLRLLGDGGLKDVQGREGVARVAPGQYWVLGWTIGLKDPMGRRWTAAATTFGDVTSSQLVTVARDKA